MKADPAEPPPPTRFDWRIRHPFGEIEDQVCVEVKPKRGLFARWRFVIPATYTGVVQWGTMKPGFESVSPIPTEEAVGGGPETLVNGPTVRWMGATEPLSANLAACLVFSGVPPHYVMFGQSDQPNGPPGSLEGITFGEHPVHPDGGA